jgi:hypothetical protein
MNTIKENFAEINEFTIDANLLRELAEIEVVLVGGGEVVSSGR